MTDGGTNRDVTDFSLRCPVPLRDYPQIVLGHGGGGQLSSELVQHLFLPAFRNDHLSRLCDSTVLPGVAGKLAFSTDSFVVRPLFFPGGNIGDLAVNGTVNDLAMSGATPLYLSAAFILEEGIEIETLADICESMARAAAHAGVQIVTGDTKVVERGHGDRCYITTSGIGVVEMDVNLAPGNARPGDVVIVSGTIGEHGMAVMSVRDGMEFESEIVSDTTALNYLSRAMLDACPGIRVMRDATRGGVASVLSEIATASNVGVMLDEEAIPISPPVQSACEFLGLDPLFVANEGRLIVIVPQMDAQRLLQTMKSCPSGQDATVIGHVAEHHPGRVAIRTRLGTSRAVAMQVGEQLPRIC